jgi:hypothetical protein
MPAADYRWFYLGARENVDVFNTINQCVAVRREDVYNLTGWFV